MTGREVPLDQKQPYHRGRAVQAANEHADHFVQTRAAQIEAVRTATRRPPVIVAPYDAELFGHWWFEGPEFLDLVVRKSCNQPAYQLSTPLDVANSGGQFQVAMPAASSWGRNGYNEIWLNSDNEWIWPHLHRATHEMTRIASEYGSAKGLTLRALNQLARELVLATASDWPFMMTMGTTVAYAESRLCTHINRFHRLLAQIREERINEGWLARIETLDNAFSYLNHLDFAEIDRAVNRS